MTVLNDYINKVTANTVTAAPKKVAGKPGSPKKNKKNTRRSFDILENVFPEIGEGSRIVAKAYRLNDEEQRQVSALGFTAAAGDLLNELSGSSTTKEKIVKEVIKSLSRLPIEDAAPTLLGVCYFMQRAGLGVPKQLKAAMARNGMKYLQLLLDISPSVGPSSIKAVNTKLKNLGLPELRPRVRSKGVSGRALFSEAKPKKPA